MQRNRTFKMGSCSILLGDHWYTPRFPSRVGKLLRITKIIPKHNDLPYLDIVRTIPNYSEHYAIPDATQLILTEEDNWWKEVTNKWGRFEIISTLFRPGTELVCQYIQDVGKYDVIDALEAFSDDGDRSIWNSYNSIWRMACQLATAIKFLHQKQLCHLDIKGENVMISNNGKRYRLIDFGFCSKEPFADFVDDMRGTPGYFPKQLGKCYEPGLPEIDANDTELINGRTRLQSNPKLVYKVDSFCFGRVVNYVLYTYDHRAVVSCFRREAQEKKRKIQKILEAVLKSDVEQRSCIIEAFALGLFS